MNRKRLIWCNDYNRSFANQIPEVMLSDQYKIYVIPIIGEQFWVTIAQGARDMADLIDVNCIVDFPQNRKAEEQIRIINHAIKSGADALLIGATDPVGISGAIEDAKAKGIKIVYVDAPAYEEAVITLATDNYSAGKIAGETMLAVLEASGIRNGSIGIFSVNTKLTTIMNREKGFNEVIKEDGQFELLNTVYTEGIPSVTKEAAESLIRTNENVVGVFGTNEGCTIGIGQAIEAAGRKVVGIGFDLEDTILEMIEKEVLQAVLVQNPYTMGYLGMAEAVAAIKGYDTGPPFINTGVTLINKYSYKNKLNIK